MIKQAIIIDLDNTIFDTAIRKHNILKDFLPQQEIPEETVREDFELLSILGPTDTTANKNFCEILDSEKGIQNYNAPIFPGVKEFLKKYVELGISIIVVTGRPKSLKKVTIEELKNANIDNYITKLYMRDIPNLSMKEFKQSQIKAIIQEYDVIVVIGDRLDDREAALNNKLPFILIRKTIPSGYILEDQNKHDMDEYVCMTWSEIDAATDTIIEGRKKLSILREDFTNSYCNWLSDLDNKCRIIATIAGILATISGNIIYKMCKITTFNDYMMVIVFCFSILSLLYAIRSITSRRTSGPMTGNAILANLKQWFAILAGRPKNWMNKPLDAIDSYNTLLKKTDDKKARAHYDFFKEQFGTYNPESLANLRLFQLRAANYSKVYAETIASRLLMIAISIMLIWIVANTILP